MLYFDIYLYDVRDLYNFSLALVVGYQPGLSGSFSDLVSLRLSVPFVVYVKIKLFCLNIPKLGLGYRFPCGDGHRRRDVSVGRYYFGGVRWNNLAEPISALRFACLQ